MKVQLIGKQRMSGTSKKTGKPYDNVIAHIIGPGRDVVGKAAEKIWLNSDTHPMDSLQIGATYELDRDSNGYPVAFELVK